LELALTPHEAGVVSSWDRSSVGIQGLEQKPTVTAFDLDRVGGEPVGRRSEHDLAPTGDAGEPLPSGKPPARDIPLGAGRDLAGLDADSHPKPLRRALAAIA